MAMIEFEFHANIYVAVKSVGNVLRSVPLISNLIYLRPTTSFINKGVTCSE